MNKILLIMARGCEFDCPNFKNTSIAEVCPASGMKNQVEAQDFCNQVVRQRNYEKRQDISNFNSKSGKRVKVIEGSDSWIVDSDPQISTTTHSIKIGIPQED